MEHELAHGRSARIVAVDEKTATLDLDGETLSWPRYLLPEKMEVGATVHLLAFAHEDAVKERARLTRQLLNELLEKTQ